MFRFAESRKVPPSIRDGRHGFRRDGAGIALRGTPCKFRFGCSNQLRLFQQINGCGAQHLTSGDCRLMPDGCFSAGNILPAVARTAIGPRCHMQLRRGALPADIPYIGGTRAKRFPGEKRKQHIIHSGTGQERFYPGGIIGIFAAAAGGGHGGRYVHLLAAGTRHGRIFCL